ncbi:hypothetical protein BT93_F1755 [Corymbia citriodora subsp. variegata]|nr:hypothetical protein BT93_F1755 [Corymbia citriodora subsp. variegata]
MAMLKRTAATTIFALLCICGLVRGDPDTSTVGYSCSTSTYQGTDLFKINLDDVLHHLRDDTAYNKFNYYYQSPWPGSTPICYGNGACNGALQVYDCVPCMTSAVTQIRSLCPMSVGAQVQLGDCRARYEQYDFTEK